MLKKLTTDISVIQKKQSWNVSYTLSDVILILYLSCSPGVNLKLLNFAWDKLIFSELTAIKLKKIMSNTVHIPGEVEITLPVKFNETSV